MSRRKSGRKRGRPRQEHARRRETTRAGRRGNPFIDRGTDQLRIRKLAIAGRENIDLSDTIGILAARGIINAEETIVLRVLQISLDTVRRGRGLTADMSVNSLWAALQAGGHRSNAWPTPTNDGRRSPADAALERLTMVRNAFFVVGKLDQLDAIMNIVEGRAADLIMQITKPQKTFAEARALAAEISELHDALAIAGAIVQQGRRRRAMAGRRMARG